MKASSAARILTSILLSGSAHTTNAQLILADFSITSDTIRVTIDGTLSGPNPTLDSRQFFLVPNTDGLNWLNRTINGVHFEQAISGSGLLTIGDQAMVGSFVHTFGENDGFEYILPGINFIFSPTSPLVGDAGTGTISASWPSGTFNPSIAQADSWSLYWGRGSTSSITEGTLQSTFNFTAVPEPHHLVLFSALGLLGFAYHQRRRHSQSESKTNSLPTTA